MKEKLRRKKIGIKVLVLLIIIAVALGGVFFFTTSKTDTQVKESAKAEQTANKMAADHIPTMQPCLNNKEIQCAGSPSIDFWPGGSEDASNHSYDRSSGSMKEVGGKITAINGNTVSLQATNNEIYQILFPINAVEEWNTNRSPNYNDYKVSVGDTLNIRYGESKQSNRTIQSSQIFTSTLAIRMIGGADGTIERF